MRAGRTMRAASRNAQGRSEINLTASFPGTYRHPRFSDVERSHKGGWSEVSWHIGCQQHRHPGAPDEIFAPQLSFLNAGAHLLGSEGSKRLPIPRSYHSFPMAQKSRVAVHGRRCCPAPEGGAPRSAVQPVGCARPRPPASRSVARRQPDPHLFGGLELLPFRGDAAPFTPVILIFINPVERVDKHRALQAR